MLQLTTIIFLIAFATLAGIHLLALQFTLYFYLPWFDILMHAFGGIIVALGFFTLRDLKLFPNKHLTLFKVICLFLCIATAWEAMEYFGGIPIYADFLSDTSLDMVMGLLGAVVGYYIGNSLRNLR